MRKLPAIAISALVIGFLSLCFYSYSQNQKFDQWIDSLDRTKYIEKDERNGQIGDNIEGNKDAKVLIIEYADFQCPGCAATFPFLSELVKEYKGQVGLIFRNFVLTYHKNGTASAYAANAAALLLYSLRINPNGKILVVIRATQNLSHILKKLLIIKGMLISS